MQVGTKVGTRRAAGHGVEYAGWCVKDGADRSHRLLRC